MLNNNFSKLVKLYEKYRRRERNRFLLKLFAFAAVVAGGYLIYTQIDRMRNSAVQVPAETVAQNNASQSTVEPQNNTTHAAPAATPPAKPLKKVAVATPKTEEMPKKIRKRTPSGKKHRDEVFQLKVSQRESLYKLLVDYKDKKSYAAAIRIAHFYLREKDYEKAVKWAVEASKKDPTQAESWIVYARAKKALGKPDVAKRALSIYLKHNYSQPAQNLLDSL